MLSARDKKRGFLNKNGKKIFFPGWLLFYFIDFQSFINSKAHFSEQKLNKNRPFSGQKLNKNRSFSGQKPNTL